MAVTIAFRNIPRKTQTGVVIYDGDASEAGVLRVAGTCNANLASCCRQLVSDWYATPRQFAANGQHPLGYSNGARWKTPVTDPWDEVYCAVLAKTSPGTNPGSVVFHSSTDSQTSTISLSSYSWVATASRLGVSSTGVETFYLDVTPGAGETIYLKGVTILEVTRTSL